MQITFKIHSWGSPGPSKSLYQFCKFGLIFFSFFKSKDIRVLFLEISVNNYLIHTKARSVEGEGQVDLSRRAIKRCPNSSNAKK